VETILHQVLDLSPVILYGVAFFGLILEGNTTLFTISFLAERGFFEVAYIAPIVVTATIVGNIFWYYVGRWSIKRPNLFVKVMNMISEPFDHHLVDNPLQTIFLTKFVYGLNCATIVRAGQLKMKFPLFLKNLMAASIPWIMVVGFFGYSFGALITVTQIRYLEIVLLIAIVVFLIIKHYFSNYARKKLRK